MTPQQVLALLGLLANLQATVDAQSAEIERLRQALPDGDGGSGRVAAAQKNSPLLDGPLR